MAANQTVWKKMLVIKFLVAEKYKLWKINRRLRDVHFSKKKYLQMGYTWICHKMSEWKRQSMEWKHTDSPVKKSSGLSA